MNDQTSPTAGGQGQGSTPWRDPFQEPQSAQGLPGVPRFGDAKAGVGARAAVLLRQARPDLLAFGILLGTGVLLGVLAGLAWYRFAPTVWLSLPADAVSQVKGNVDQYALLVAPQAKGIASVDGYYFMFTGAAGLLLGAFGFWLARRGLLGGRDQYGQPVGAAVGAWAGVLLGGAATAGLAAALGRWISLPDPVTVLRTIAAGHNFHATVALHAQGLYLAAPVLGTVLFLAMTAAFTKPEPVEPADGQRAPVFFTTDNPYGFPEGGRRNGAAAGQDGGAGPDNGGGQSRQPGHPGPSSQTGNGTSAQQADPFRS